MSDAAPYIVGLIIVLVILGLVSVVGVFKRRDSQDATGLLSRETVKRDRSVEMSPLGVQPTGREIERIATAERREGGTTLELPTKPDVVTYIPPDPEQLAVTPRAHVEAGGTQRRGVFFSRAGSPATSASPWRLPWPR